jgi:cell division protein FtsQ
VEGEGAPARVPDLDRLLAAAPDIAGRVASAEWVGERRWTLTFATGQELALPQGEDKAAAALASFARLDGDNGLLGGQVAAFDMRSPERIYLRVPGRAAAAAAAEKEGI